MPIPASASELHDRVVDLERDKRDLQEELDQLRNDQTAKYRRLDALRVAQKWFEHTGKHDGILDLASAFAQFVETGDTGGAKVGGQEPIPAKVPT